MGESERGLWDTGRNARSGARHAKRGERAMPEGSESL
jgi:hypothetical protein